MSRFSTATSVGICRNCHREVVAYGGDGGLVDRAGYVCDQVDPYTRTVDQSGFVNHELIPFPASDTAQLEEWLAIEIRPPYEPPF